VSKLAHRTQDPWWKRMGLGPLEWQLMESIWQLETCSVHDMVRTIPEKLAYTTVMTTADRLFRKGILKRKKVNRKFLYSTRMNRQQLDVHFARRLLSQLCLLPVSTRRVLIQTLQEGLGKGASRNSATPDQERTVGRSSNNRSSTSHFGMSGLA
jgi:predicted transcriptional regulator